MIVNTPSDVAMSGSTPTCHVADFDIGSTLWDFNSMGFMDDNPLWTLNTGFFNDMNGAGAPMQLPDVDLDDTEYLGNIHERQNQNQPRIRSIEAPMVMDMRDRWFTKIERSTERQHHLPRLPASVSSSKTAASPSEPEIVDEECRRGLSKALIPPAPQEYLLPSSGFLVRCFG